MNREIFERRLRQFWNLLRSNKCKSDAENLKIEFSEYVEYCLYDPQFGYYAQSERKRVGAEGADFFTSESLPHGVFGELMECAARSIASKTFSDDNFIDGAELVELALEGDLRLFNRGRTIGFSDNIELKENLIIASNELLDARPFSKYRYSKDTWEKGFIELQSGKIEFNDRMSPINAREIFEQAPKDECDFLDENFPNAKIENFRVERSKDAEMLFEKICTQPWRGVLIFADYFRNSDEIARFPEGTARAYFQHSVLRRETELASLADITFSPCSDIFENIARRCHLTDVSTLSQESFFVKFAGNKIREILESNNNPLDPRRRELVQLLSPSLMGLPFRVMSAVKLA